MTKFVFGLLVVVVVILLALIIFYNCTFNRIPLNPLKTLPEISNYKPLGKKVCIFMIVTPEIMEYAEHSIEINKKYAKFHGYDFRTFGQLTPDLPINFSKLQATLDLMANNNYDYIIHIDADAIVVEPEYPLEGIIDSYMPSPIAFIAAEDCYNAKICSKPGHINSGVYIVKNNLLGRNIIKLWLDSARSGRCAKYTNQFPNCQLVFSHCVQWSIWAGFIRIVPYNLLNGRDGLFIRHLMQHTSRDRIDNFKQEKMETNDEWQKGETRMSVY